MAIPASKADLLAAMIASHDALRRDLARVPPDRARLPSMPGHVAGSIISPGDLVAYLIGWNELVLSWLARDDRGAPVNFPATGYDWTQLGLLAQKLYADHRAQDWVEVLARLDAAVAALIATVTARSEAELYGQPWYGKYSKGRMIQLNSAAPWRNARARIRGWLRDQGA